MTEHFYSIEFEGLCLNEKDLEKLLKLKLHFLFSVS